ncbi:MAG: hypothetical protein SGI97_03605 [candidate division Zixibacteria bacterium]|mgnify:CR=1 FL=1|nr:hypothetical protein [candidate division Zixibacteria bacterium]
MVYFTLKSSINLTLIVIAVLSMASSTQGTQTDPDLSSNILNEDSVKIIIRVERLKVSDMRIADTLDVTVESFGYPIAGYSLLIGMTSSFVEILEVLPGEIQDSCGWEFFNAAPVKTENRPNYPRSLWKAIALAKMSADTSKPICYGVGRKASLLRLVLSNEHIAQVPDTTAAIFFFWAECSDNVISDVTGSQLLVSERIVDYYPVDVGERENIFPTRRGTPNQCINLSRENHPKRLLEFYNGGVEFVLGGDPLIPQSDSSSKFPKPDND